MVEPMTRDEIIAQLRAAKTAHVQWLSDALALIAGLAQEQNHVPILHTHCEFGRWYYGAGQRLAPLTAYETIEAPHEELHRIYSQIFSVLFGADDRSRWAKLLGAKGRISKKRQEEAKLLVDSLLAVSRTMLECIARLEQQLLNLSEDQLAAMP